MLVVTILDNGEQLKKYGIARIQELQGSVEWYDYNVFEIKAGDDSDEMTYDHVSKVKHRFLDGITKLTAIAVAKVSELRSPDVAH